MEKSIYWTIDINSPSSIHHHHIEWLHASCSLRGWWPHEWIEKYVFGNLCLKCVLGCRFFTNPLQTTRGGLWYLFMCVVNRSHHQWQNSLTSFFWRTYKLKREWLTLSIILAFRKRKDKRIGLIKSLGLWRMGWDVCPNPNGSLKVYIIIFHPPI